MNYEVSQIFTVTLFYLNSVSDPMIYILGYPSVKKYIRKLTHKHNSHTSVVLHGESSTARPGYAAQPISAARSDTDLHIVARELHAAALHTCSMKNKDTLNVREVGRRVEAFAGLYRGSLKLDKARRRDNRLVASTTRLDNIAAEEDTIELGSFRNCTVLSNSPDSVGTSYILDDNV